jgi:hypothetical protein
MGTEGELIVICCIECQTDREVPGTHTAWQSGECPSCGSIGWAYPQDLARDDLYHALRPAAPRLRGEELRTSLAHPFPGPPPG